MYRLDKITITVLGFLALFFVYLGLQWSPENIQPETDVNTNLIGKMEQRTLEYPLISGIEGTLFLNEEKLEFPVRSSVTDSVIDFTSVQTASDSWMQYNPNLSSFVFVGEDSEVLKNDYTYTLEQGTIWVNSKNIRVISSDIRVEPGTAPNQQTAEYVVTTEPNKVRVFVLSESVTLTAFGKTQQATAGTGFSLFLDRAYISDYEIGAPVSISNPTTNPEFPFGYMTRGLVSSWNKGERAENYTVMVSKIDSTHAYTNIEQVPTTDVRLRYLNPGEYSIRVTYQNNYATWGRTSSEASFKVGGRTFAPIEKPEEVNTAEVELREYEGDMLVGAALNFDDEFLTVSDLNAVVYGKNDKWWLQPLDISLYQPVATDGYFESLSRISEAYSVIFFDPLEFTPAASFEAESLPTIETPGVKAITTVAHPTAE